MKKRLLFCLLLLCIVLSACGAETAKPTEDVTSAEITQTELVTEPATQPPEPTTPWQAPERGAEVRLLYDETLSLGEEVQCVYQVPLLCSTGGDTDAVNREIEACYTPLMERVLNGNAPDIAGISYTVCRFRIYTLSLLIRTAHTDGTDSFSVYTLSLEDGRRLNNEEVLQVVNISMENFLSETRIRAGEYYDSLYADREQDADYLTQRALACGEGAVNADMLMYPDEEGHLMLISPFAAPGSTKARLLIYPLQKEFESSLP